MGSIRISKEKKQGSGKSNVILAARGKTSFKRNLSGGVRNKNAINLGKTKK